MSIIIPRCGYNRNTHRSIVYGPQRLGGAGFRHLATEQGTLQVTYFLRHCWRKRSQVGRLFRCVLSWLQLSVGVSFPVLEQPTQALPHDESKWLSSLRSFLATQKLSIHLDEPDIPPLQRTHDSYLMDHILQSNHYTAAEVRKLNYCRLYLNVVAVSDIAQPSGNKVDPSFYTGHLTASSSRPKLMSVHQERPSEQEWKLWRRAHLLWCNLAGSLHQPLGMWLHPIQSQRRYQQAYRHRRRVWIHCSDTHEYQEYRIRSTPNPLRLVNRTATVNDIPTQAQPIEVQQISAPEEWIITHAGHLIVEPTPPFNRQTATFTEFISSLDERERELLQCVTLEVEPFDFCTDLQPHSKAVCDGSVRNNKHSSFGWAIRDEAGNKVATGMGPAPPGTKPTSYRAEAYGMLSIMWFLIRIAEFTEMSSQWQGVLGTESQSLLDTLSGKQDRDPQEEDTPIPMHGQEIVLDALCPDWDVLKEIQESRVQGHQDRTTTYNALNQMGQLNVDADAHAARFQDEHGAYRPFVPLMTHTRAHHLVGPQGTITSRYATRIRYIASAVPLRAQLLKKNHWSPANYQSINWESHGAALRKMTTKRRIHFTKLVHDILPTTAQANRYDKGNRTCPLCPCTAETRDHVLRCPSSAATKWRDSFQTNLRDFFRETQTAPVLTQPKSTN